MDTKSINAVSFTPNLPIQDEVKKTVTKLCLDKIYNELLKHLWIKFDSGASDGGYYVPKFEMLVGDPERSTFPINKYPSAFLGLPTQKFTQKQATFLFWEKQNECPFIFNGAQKGFSYTLGQIRKNYITVEGGCINLFTGEYFNWNDSDTDHLKIPSAKLNKKVFISSCLNGQFKIKSKLSPLLNEFITAYKKSKTSKIETPDDLDEFIFQNSAIAGISTDDALPNITLTNQSFKEFITNILSADEIRAGIEPYDCKCIEDVNLGNWELWQDKNELANNALIQLEKSVVARNPVSDIHENGIVGIDFGTKSTIVSYQDGNDINKLHRIGIGQLSKEAVASHYENPTVMEFISIENFLNDYDSSAGRPLTKLEDLTVSHKAYNSMINSESSDEFYSFFYDIKQWCGDSSRYKQIKIIDKTGAEYILPPYLEIKEGEFDPVEIYAYYLGLHINNMRNGIFMKYILSFPVSYQKAVKEKLLLSFTRGLRKSLPNAVLNDEEAMQSFSIIQGVSEPAAYAISALKAYNFIPKTEGEKIFYGIFDFGGGTTDFDFGLWRMASDERSERRYDYVISHFGAEGDQYLGGENLLELMAYEIFKANRQLLLKTKDSAGFSFFKPAECDDFPGSEVLISGSQEAKRNTKQLVEKLRPLWEGLSNPDPDKSDSNPDEPISPDNWDVFETIAPEATDSPQTALVKELRSISEMRSKQDLDHGYIVNPDCTILNDGYITVDLFDKNGDRKPGVQLFIENPQLGIHVDLIDILEKRIDRGVSNFFEAMKLTFIKNDTRQAEKYYIFLAGNSSKSPILKNAFKKHIEEINSDIGKRENDTVTCFELFPPLGTEEAMAIQAQRGIQADQNDLFAPTGKTGVALGLLEGRPGGNIKVISETSASDEIKFKYYIGKNKRNKFKVILGRNCSYGAWIDLEISADLPEFEIYYSTLPEVTTNDASISDISKKMCRLSDTNDDGEIFIRAVSPSIIEFCASYSIEGAQNGDYISEPKAVDLSK